MAIVLDAVGTLRHVYMYGVSFHPRRLRAAGQRIRAWQGAVAGTACEIRRHLRRAAASMEMSYRNGAPLFRKCKAALGSVVVTTEVGNGRR